MPSYHFLDRSCDYLGPGGSIAARSVEVGAVEQTYDRRLGVVTNFAATIGGTPIVVIPATLRSIFLLSSRDATLELNSPTSPTQTIALKAGIPLEWEATSGYHANPITASFSGVYVTTAAAARVQIRILST